LRLAEMIEENNTEPERKNLRKFLKENLKVFEQEETLSLVKQSLDYAMSNVIMKTTQT